MSLEVDPTTPLTASGNLRRRQVVNRLAEGGANAAALLAVVVLGIVIASVAVRGAPALSLDFLIQSPPRFGGPGGGIAPAIVGTAVIIFTAAVSVGAVPSLLGLATQPTQALPWSVYSLCSEHRYADEIRHTQYGMVLTLVLLVLILNLVAIVLRARVSRKQRG